jgi:hypothetical protein
MVMKTVAKYFSTQKKKISVLLIFSTQKKKISVLLIFSTQKKKILVLLIFSNSQISNNSRFEPSDVTRFPFSRHSI